MLYTSEGLNIDSTHPLQEYPYPQFYRHSYINLNGQWDFQIDKSPSNPEVYLDKVIVPFSVETYLSGLGISIKPDDYLHYRTYFSIPHGFDKGRIILHFEAVDQICDVFVNGINVGHHEGGYLPFQFELLELKETMNELLVVVKDDVTSNKYPRGKQSIKSKNIWYTQTSGIWGSVWLESVPFQYIQNIKITPNFDLQVVDFQVEFEGKIVSSKVEVTFNSVPISSGELNEGGFLSLPVSKLFRPWSPQSPSLYEVKITVNDDCISSYFAMRKFSYTIVEGKKVFALNNKPYFLSGVLDQGYWPDGGLTAPSDQAMINDIQAVKDMGFNCIRKHIKIEPMRWYYHCDRLGIIVIQDFVNGGDSYNPLRILLSPFLNLKLDDKTKFKKTGRKSQISRDFFYNEMPLYVKHLYNVPCIAIWTLFNEGWGQFEADRLTHELHLLDPTRLVDSTSGWYDQGCGDFNSKHIYFKKLKPINDYKRILALTEFGGYSLRVKNHDDKATNFGYRYFSNPEKLQEAIRKIYLEHVKSLIIDEGLSIAIWTQLTDVEQEMNGLLSYDRKVTKVDVKAMQEINAQLNFGYQDYE